MKIQICSHDTGWIHECRFGQRVSLTPSSMDVMSRKRSLCSSLDSQDTEFDIMGRNLYFFLFLTPETPVFRKGMNIFDLFLLSWFLAEPHGEASIGEHKRAHFPTALWQWYIRSPIKLNEIIPCEAAGSHCVTAPGSIQEVWASRMWQRLLL